MYDITEQMQRWIADGHDPTVATVVATRGFSSRAPGSSTAWIDGVAPVGALLGGVSGAALSGSGPGLVDVTVTEDEAAAGGLACGGTATVLVQRSSAYPAAVWPQLATRDPLCLVTTFGAGAPVTEAFTPATIRSATGFGDTVPRLFGRGVTATAVPDGEPATAVVALWPVPTLMVVGDGLIANALRDTAGLLGWSAQIVPVLGEASGMHRCDAVVVLSHDRDVDGPALQGALRGGAGYVGALGSRRTQAARREWLTAHEVADDEQARIHGPAGLDIDAHTPAEIAISIVAEILAGRAGSTGDALRERSGPVHTVGVQAPPPRY